MKEQMRIELHNETEYTECISFQDIWTHASRLKYAGCRVAAITDRNSVDGLHMEHDFMRRGIQPIYGVTLSCIDVDDRYDVVLLAANLIGRDNIFRLIELLESKERSDRSCHSASAGSKVSGDDHARLRLSGIYQ